MFRDLFDRLHLLLAFIVIITIVLILSGFIDSNPAQMAVERSPAVERAMQDRARATFLLDTYAPIEQLVATGRSTEALLKLQEMEKAYPGEPHTSILRGAILVNQGVLAEGLAQYAYAVKVNGDYVDKNSSLNRRTAITRLVDSAIPKIRESLRAEANPTLEKSLKDAYYLQSRLAGGCE